LRLQKYNRFYMDNALKWYAVYTRSRFEKKAARWLTEQGIEAYVPLQRVMRQWSDRRKLVLEPAIPSYVFVHIDHRLYYKVLETPGVVRYVFFDGKPAVVRDEEIDTLKRVMDSDLEVECLPDDLQPGTQVRIVQGPLTGIEGEFVEYMGKQKVALRIEAIRQVMMVTLSPQVLEVLR
jgi:transcription antitermination factor NusG